MARDVELDVIANDKTGRGARSAERNLKKVGETADGVTRHLGRAGEQWSRGFQRLSGAASRWANSGDSAGKRFARGVGGGLSKLGELGGRIGGGLSKAVSAAGPQVAVAVAAVLAGAAVAAGPVLAGAIVGGAGVGGVVGGLLLASKDARVRTAFDGLKEEVGSGLQEAAQRFVPAALESVKEARAAFRGMLPDLRRLFNVSASWAAPLTRSLGRMASGLLSGLTAAVAKAGPVVAAIGDSLVFIGREVGGVFRKLSDDGAIMAFTLRGALGLVAITIRMVGTALNALVETFEWFIRKIPGGNKILNDLDKAQTNATGSAFNLSHGFRALGDEADAAATGLTRAKQEADEFVNNNIALGRAQIAAREAIRSTTAAIKENSKAKLTNKQRADANMSALYDLADAFNQESAAGDRSGISADKAKAAYDRNRASLIRMATQAGMSKTRAKELADQLLQVPKNVNVKVNVTGHQTAIERANAIQAAIKRITGKTVRIGVVGGRGGNLEGNRWGGLYDGRGVKRMAAGGILGAGIVGQPTVLFGERETGGEAFIPRRGDLARSRQIAQTVVRDWLGGDVRWGRGGGGHAEPRVMEALVPIQIGDEVVRVVRVQLREHDRQLKRRVGAGAGK